LALSLSLSLIFFLKYIYIFYILRFHKETTWVYFNGMSRIL
jgi:hypothetical protein